jgi:hypothetical protein
MVRTGNVSLVYAQTEWCGGKDQRSCFLLQTNSLYYSSRNASNENKSVEVNNVLNEVVKIIHFVKVSALNSLFSLICVDMGSLHLLPLERTEVRRLFRGKVLSRVFELRHKLLLFIGKIKTDWAKYLRINIGLLNWRI